MAHFPRDMNGLEDLSPQAFVEVLSGTLFDNLGPLELQALVQAGADEFHKTAKKSWGVHSLKKWQYDAIFRRMSFKLFSGRRPRPGELGYG